METHVASAAPTNDTLMAAVRNKGDPQVAMKLEPEIMPGGTETDDLPMVDGGETIMSPSYPDADPLSSLFTDTWEDCGIYGG